MDNTDKRVFTDEEINELAEWMDDLTLSQAFFIKESYEAMLLEQAQNIQAGNIHVH